MDHRPLRGPGAWAAGLLALAVLVVWTGGGGALASWATGTVSNSGDSSQTGSLAFSHGYQTSGTCAAGPRTSTATACSGSPLPTVASSNTAATSTDTITNGGQVAASQVRSQLTAPGCLPVAFANAKTLGNPMLARYGTTFHTSGGPMDSAGYVTLSGSNPGGYATSVVQQTQPTGPGGLITLSTTYTYALGIWFSTAAAGPLFEISTSPSNASGSDDRILWIDASGVLHLIYDQAGDAMAQTTSTNFLNTGWHFAYVTLTNTVTAALGVVVSASNTETLYVDGAQVGTATQTAALTGNASKFSATAGYWHLGYAPTSKTGLGSAYLAGSLSNMVVWDTPNAPAPPTAANLASQASFQSWVSGGSGPTERWKLDDTGTATVGSSQALPSSMTAPCSMVDIAFSFANPTDSIATLSVAAFANGLARTVAAPGGGASQTMTVTYSRAAGYNSDISGLHLYLPLTITEVTNPTSTWLLPFTWSDVTSVLIA